MAYKFSELSKVKTLFESLFHTGFKQFYDNMSPFFGCLCLDIFAFDDWLHKQIGNYENKGMSMADAVRQHYGDKAMKLIDDLISYEK